MDVLNIALWFAASLIFLLGPIILVHELGHFLAARWAGVRVEEFGLGLPPRMLTLWGEPGTIAVGGVRLAAPRRLTLPLGIGPGVKVEALARQEADGSLRLVRLRPLEQKGPQRPKEESEERAGLWEREDGVVVVRGPITLYEPGIRYTLNWLPLGGFVRMSGEEDPSDPRSLAAQPKRRRLAVLLAGPAMNLLAAVLLLTIGYATGYPEKFQAVIEWVEPGTPAEAAGLLPGDRIVAINGQEIVTGTGHIRDIIVHSAGQPLTLDLIRVDVHLQRGTESHLVGDKWLLGVALTRRTLHLQPTAKPRFVEGRWLLGIMMKPWPDPDSVRRYPLPQAIGKAGEEIYQALSTIVQLPSLLAQGEISPREARPTSAVGINSILTLSLQESLEWHLAFPMLEMAAMVSFFLGLTNLLPLPALDGGRILFIVIEAVRGRRVRPEVEALVHQVGMFVLLALMFLFIVQDIVNPVIAWSSLNR